MTDKLDNARRERMIEYGKEAYHSRQTISSCPYDDVMNRDWWQRGYHEAQTADEWKQKQIEHEKSMQTFGAALRLFAANAAAARDAWPQTQWLRRIDGKIMLINTDGTSEPWAPTHDDLLATDWGASSGVVGWTGLNLDINGNPWPPKDQA